MRDEIGHGLLLRISVAFITASDERHAPAALKGLRWVFSASRIAVKLYSVLLICVALQQGDGWLCLYYC